MSFQYTFCVDPSDNNQNRANVHHTCSHYHMAAAHLIQYGRSKWLMTRHLSQGSRLQANRMTAQETARTHGIGMSKVGKSLKMSNMKRRGEAGGSKNCGGDEY